MGRYTKSKPARRTSATISLNFSFISQFTSLSKSLSTYRICVGSKFTLEVSIETTLHSILRLRLIHRRRATNISASSLAQKLSDIASSLNVAVSSCCRLFGASNKVRIAFANVYEEPSISSSFLMANLSRIESSFSISRVSIMASAFIKSVTIRNMLALSDCFISMYFALCLHNK